MPRRPASSGAMRHAPARDRGEQPAEPRPSEAFDHPSGDRRASQRRDAAGLRDEADDDCRRAASRNHEGNCREQSGCDDTAGHRIDHRRDRRRQGIGGRIERHRARSAGKKADDAENGREAQMAAAHQKAGEDVAGRDQKRDPAGRQQHGVACRGNIGRKKREEGQRQHDIGTEASDTISTAGKTRPSAAARPPIAPAHRGAIPVVKHGQQREDRERAGHRKQEQRRLVGDSMAAAEKSAMAKRSERNRPRSQAWVPSARRAVVRQ